MENNQNSLKRNRYLLIFSRILNRYVLLVNSDRSIPVMFRFHLYKRSHQHNVRNHRTRATLVTNQYALKFRCIVLVGVASPQAIPLSFHRTENIQTTIAYINHLHNFSPKSEAWSPFREVMPLSYFLRLLKWKLW